MNTFITWLSTVLITVWVTFSFTLATSDNPTKAQIGYTYQELQEMKKNCEKDLTRSENCTIVVSYKPEANKETKQ